MDEYTLISFIGKGRIKDGKDGEYETTTYQFPDTGKEWTTSLFVEAILKTEYHIVKKVILVGTITSSWDLLIIDRDNDNNADFYLKLNNECNKSGISEESRKELKSRLQEWYNIPFEIIVHTAKLYKDTIADILFRYEKIPELLEDNTHILFDITHGFRSMPLLVYQSLQLNLQKRINRKVELLYAELSYGDGKISPVHDLSEYWEYYEISSAKNLFEEKLDGRLLADKLEQPWKSGANFLRTLSNIVECNFSLQIPEALKQLKNALKDFDKTEHPKWIATVKKELEKMYKKLCVKGDEKYPDAKTILEYSKILHEKSLITQEVIALQVVVETAIAEKIDPDKKGDYGWFNGYYDAEKKMKIEGIGDKKLRELYKKSKTLGPYLGKLESLRNQIAHGGGKDRKKKLPHQKNIDGILKPIDKAIQELFNLLDQEDN